MLTVTTASIWGITVALSVVAGTWEANEERPPDESRLLQQACAGLPSTRQIEDALSTMRAMSNGGSDPICTTIALQPAARQSQHELPLSRRELRGLFE